VALLGRGLRRLGRRAHLLGLLARALALERGLALGLGRTPGAALGSGLAWH
jgi:hypothetical protein